MRLFRSARWLLLALLLPLIPATQARAGVFISVGFAPPVLPVYEQPPCPEPNWIWTPGYWAYDYNAQNYYWVPGAWVPAPQPGYLWTPPYWGWESGVYIFHPGYWGPHVGYYGGVNYGFGYMGIGFVGGAWHGGVFAYNTAVVRVNTVVIHNVYVDRTIVQRNTIVNDRRVAYAGGPGGIRHDPTPEERVAMRESHMAATSMQQQHFQAARADRSNFYNVNHGRPQNVAVARPLAAPNHAAPAERPAMNNGGARGEYRPAPGGQQARPAPESRPSQQMRPESRPAPQSRPESRPAPERQQHEQPRHESKPPKEKEPRR